MKTVVLLLTIFLFACSLSCSAILSTGFSLLSPQVNGSITPSALVSNHPQIHSIYKIKADGSSLEEYLTQSSVLSYPLLSSIQDGDTLFLGVQGSLDLTLSTTHSTPAVSSQTGYGWFRANSQMSLQSLTQTALSSRAFAVFGLHNNVWYGYFHNPNQVFQNIRSQLLQQNSIRNLTELTPGFSYFVGNKPDMDSVQVLSLAQLPAPMSTARIKFQTRTSSSGELRQLSLSRTDAQGDWSGEVFYPKGQSRLIAKLTTGSTILFSPLEVDSSQSQSIQTRLNFSTLTSHLAHDLSAKEGKTVNQSLHTLATSLFTVEEQASFSPFSRALETLSTQGVHSPLLVSQSSSTPQSFGNGILIQALDEALGGPTTTLNQQYMNLLTNPSAPIDQGLSNLYTQILNNAGSQNVGTLLNSLNNTAGLNPRVESSREAGNDFLILPHINIGNQSARITSVENNIASLTPLDTSTTTFVFNGFPSSLEIPLSSFSPLRQATGTILIELKLVSDPASLAATVEAAPFRIEYHQGQQSGSCLVSSNSKTYKVCAQIDDQALINASYKLPDGSFAIITDRPNSLDSGDTLLSSPDILQIPVLSYVQKSQSNLTENFTGVVLSLDFRFSGGIRFRLAPDRSTVIQGFRVERLLVN